MIGALRSSPTWELPDGRTSEDAADLRAGWIVRYSGPLTTARDAAHRRLLDLIEGGGRLPFPVSPVIYHCGPLMTRSGEGWRAVSAGPTTSDRFSEMAARLVGPLGTRALIGKGGMSEAVYAALERAGGAYLVFPGGAGSLAAGSVTRVEGPCWEDLGMPEAVWTLEVEGLGPLIVVSDASGGRMALGGRTVGLSSGPRTP